jgi:uncharacterized protein
MIDPRIYEQFNSHPKAPFALQDATVLVLAMVGSHSHGTYIPPDDPNAVDDVDYMGVVIPPPSYTFGIKQWEGLNFQFQELDCVFYSFRKFVNLLIKSNPNVMGLLWLKDEHYIHTEPRLWEWMIAHRDDFASERAFEAFIGYGDSQIRKMTHFDIHAQNTYDNAVALITAAGWTEEAVVFDKHRPMPNMKAVSELLDGWSAGCHPSERGAAQDKLVLDEAIRDVKHTHAKFFQGYMGQKRKTLIRKYGYDVKNAAHLVRILAMLVGYLNTGRLEVYREDADHLKAIKQGKFTLEEVKEMAILLTEEAEEASKHTTLPTEPNIEVIDQLVQDIYLNAYGLEKFHVIP